MYEIVTRLSAMAQYYQIVGQGQQLTLEDLQRYMPNICLDSIILNQDEQQYPQQQVNINLSRLNYLGILSRWACISPHLSGLEAAMWLKM